MTLKRSGFLLVLSLGISFYVGRQSSLIDRVVLQQDLHISDWQHEHLTITNTAAAATKRTGGGAIHERIEIKENGTMFKELLRPLVTDALKQGAKAESLKSCSQPDVQPYLDIMQSVHTNPQSYEKNNKNECNFKCPLVFLFYYEGGTQTLLDRWTRYYSNIATKCCIKLIAPKRYRNVTDVHQLVALGYELIGPDWPIKQDKVININLDRLQKDAENYGEDTIVSVNDLDHLLVWFAEDGTPNRYSSYSDMVLLYAYELLSTSGCANQMMAERFSVPCTCLLEDNSRYINLGEGKTVYSTYGKTNKFHPTTNFYLRNGRPPGINTDEWQTGTVYANLRGFDQDCITHHKIGYKSKKRRSEAAYAGVLHFRSDSFLTTSTKYMHFLLRNGWMSNHDSTVEDVLFCASASTSELLSEKKRCLKVKEIANIIALVHQKRLCLEAGYSEEHCMTDLTCCLTEPGWPSQ